MSAVIESATATPSDPQPPTGDGRLIAGRFRLLEPLGRGGMGRVYRGRDELLGRPVAVKLIYDDAIVDSDVRHACALEARAAARLNHPGIVRILDSGFDDGHLYVVMSLAEGRTLSEIVRADGPIPVVRALEIAMQVADALEAAHQEGIVHCDVKPSNLIVRPDGTVQLVDFGIARIAASTTSLDSSTLQGSAEYVAPEQVEGSAVDGRTDLYALGVVLYEMLAGRTPFGGGTIASVLARRLVNDPPPLRESVPSLPDAVDRLVRRMLARDPADRVQTAGQLHAALASARQATLAATLPPPPAATLTATMPISQLRKARMSSRIGSARAGASRQQARLSAAGARAMSLAAAAALATIHSGRALAERLQPFLASHVSGGSAQLSRSGALVLQRVRRQSLMSGLGIAVVLGLLIGTAAARCGVAGASAEAVAQPDTAIVQPSAETPPQPTAAAPQPTVAVVQPAATQPPAPTAVPTATLPPPTAQPTLEPTAVPEPTAAPPPPAPEPPAPPVQAVQPLSAPAAGPQERAPGQEKKPDDQKPAARQPDPPKKPDAPAPKPEAKKPEGNGQAGRGNEKQESKPRGNNGNGNGPQKKR